MFWIYIYTDGNALGGATDFNSLLLACCQSNT